MTVELDDIMMETVKEFGEVITYVPAGDADDAREVMAVVDRQPWRRMAAQSGLGKIPALTITVCNHAAALSENGVGGISSTEIDTGTDKIELPLRIGETPSSRTIKSIAIQDEGGMELELA